MSGAGIAAGEFIEDWAKVTCETGEAVELLTASLSDADTSSLTPDCHKRTWEPPGTEVWLLACLAALVYSWAVGPYFIL